MLPACHPAISRQRRSDRGPFVPEQSAEDEVMNVNGVAAVVTGAASGLGEATARELARRGARVAVLDRDAGRGEQVAPDIGGTFCEVDVTSDEKVAAAFAKARAAHGQERILVNCAGVATAAPEGSMALARAMASSDCGPPCRLRSTGPRRRPSWPTDSWGA